LAYDCISLTRHEMIGIVTLQRPQALNALNHQMIEELEQVFMELETDEKVKAVIITGEKHFAAGADINDMLDFNPEQARAFSFRHFLPGSKPFPNQCWRPSPVLLWEEGWNWLWCVTGGLPTTPPG